MNNEELNELTALHKSEVGKFHEIDRLREETTAENWRKAGNRGKLPHPFMQLEELPECFQNDEPFELKEVDESMEGRGQRRRNIVSYNDGLSDDAWAMASYQNHSSIHLAADAPFSLSRSAKIFKNLRSVPGTRKIVALTISC